MSSPTSTSAASAAPAAVPRRCRDCGAAVAPGRAVCPHCRGADLVEDASARAMSVDDYERFQGRRRLAVSATVLTTVLLMALALGVGLAFQDVAHGGSSAAGGESGLAPLLRAVAVLLVINPMVIAAVGLVLGVLSHRLWYRLFTGERAATEFSILAALGGGRARRP
jgi:hypothetical protein